MGYSMFAQEEWWFGCTQSQGTEPGTYHKISIQILQYEGYTLDLAYMGSTL
jgi:hypothetical protein